MAKAYVKVTRTTTRRRVGEGSGRKKLKQIDSVEDFDRMLNNLMASEEDKKIIEMHYKQGKSLGYIADILGMSESSVKNKHRKLLIKIGNIM